MKQTTLKITAMHCASCAMNIDLELEDMTGMKSVNTSYASGLTKIEFDEELISLAKIQEQIATLGYTAAEV